MITNKNVALRVGLVAICTIGIFFNQSTAQPEINQTASRLEISVGPDKIIVQACTPDTLRLDYRPGGIISPRTATIAQIPCGLTKTTISGTNPILMQTTKMQISIDPSTLALEIKDSAGKIVLRDAGLENWRKKTFAFLHNPQDSLYGISVKQYGLLRQTGGAVEAGSQGQGGGPFVWSSAGYGVLTDSDGGVFVNENDTLAFRGGSRLNTEFFVMLGQPADIIKSVSAITGKPTMFPKWTLGFMNSEWGINQTELNTHVAAYRAKSIPIDAFILDFDWKAWGEDNYGEFRWNEKNFPDGASGKLKTQMDALGIKLMGIAKPRVHLDTVQGADVKAQNMALNTGSLKQDYFSTKTVILLDFAKAQTRTWFWQHSKAAFDTGLVAWWNDEADESQGNFQFLNMQRAMFEGQRQDSQLRAFSLNRNFYLGAQRYAYAMWSGDIGSNFLTMGLQKNGLLGATTLAQPHWSMDTGGFSGDPSPELYTRWMQFAAFTPIFRVHGAQNKQRQPWVFGEQAEALATEAINLRYQLLPYMYSYERRANQTGVGLVKPLVFDYPKDPKAQDETNSWMFGDWLLVSPVTQAGATEQEMYLPAGTWTDFFKGTVYQGGQTIKYPINAQTLKDVPLFIKAGAILPNQDVQNFIGEKPVTRLWVDVFPSFDKTSFNYYDDDCQTYGYEHGNYFEQNISTQLASTGATIELGKSEGMFQPELKYFVFKVHGLAGKPEGLNRFANLPELDAADTEGYATGKDLYGDVAFVKLQAGNAKNIFIGK